MQIICVEDEWEQKLIHQTSSLCYLYREKLPHCLSRASHIGQLFLCSERFMSDRSAIVRMNCTLGSLVSASSLIPGTTLNVMAPCDWDYKRSKKRQHQQNCKHIKNTKLMHQCILFISFYIISISIYNFYTHTHIPGCELFPQAFCHLQGYR